jgi:Tfp pilus assembly protein PilN
VTVQTESVQLIGAGTGLLPRVNLLPPEIAEKAAFRKVQAGLGAALALTVVAVGAAYVSSTHGVSAAKADLDTASQRTTSLQAEAAKYRNVTAIYAAADAAQAQLTTAMGDEIRFSQLLNDLSLSVPSNIWLNSVSYTTAPPVTVGSPAASTVPALGAFTVSATGFSHDDVAAWLESIAGLKTYDSPYFSNSTESLLGTKPIVTFAATANLTAKAQSGRYTKPAGG